jgi:hypothetical protein
MHPPIARAAQDLDEVDHALKLALDAEKRIYNPLPIVSQNIAKIVEKKPKPVKPAPVMIADPNNPGVLVKRKRGRPRKHPLPESVPKPLHGMQPQLSLETSH